MTQPRQDPWSQSQRRYEGYRASQAKAPDAGGGGDGSLLPALPLDPPAGPVPDLDQMRRMAAFGGTVDRAPSKGDRDRKIEALKNYQPNKEEP